MQLKELIEIQSVIKDAMKAIESSETKIAVIVDEDCKLKGTITDGDIRRAFIAGKTIETSVSEIMNTEPAFGHIDDHHDYLLELMEKKRRKQVPLLDDHQRVVKVVSVSQLLKDEHHNNLIFILAGGLGTRLYPLTKSTPKPMLNLGEKPILEHIVENFISQGFERFCIAVRYQHEKIMEYFSDGNKWGVEITYIRETEPLGTGGALGLLENKEEQPIIVINGDIITNLNANHLVDFHNEANSCATIVTRTHSIDIPYGVLELDGFNVLEIKEKPSFDVMVNAGVYCVNWDIVEIIKNKSVKRIDMPEAIIQAGEEGKNIKAYPICEYWVDIGHKDDLHKARIDYDSSDK